MNKWMRTGMYLLSIALGVGMSTFSGKAENIPACGLTDGCTSSGYNKDHYTCYSTTRCWNVDRYWCGVPGKWLYEDYSTFEIWPCLNVPCGQGSKCLKPTPPVDPID